MALDIRLPTAAEWWPATRQNAAPVVYREYTPKTPTAPESLADPGVQCRGVKGSPRAERRDGLPVVAAAWVLFGLDSRPALRSQVVDGGGQAWRIDSAAGVGPWDCETVAV